MRIGLPFSAALMVSLTGSASGQGHLLALTNNADRSRPFAAIHMHENRLSILEATVPERAPEPGIFQQSMGFVDREGNGIRYQSVYSNIFPAPPRTRGGQGGAGAATPAEAGR